MITIQNYALPIKRISWLRLSVLDARITSPISIKTAFTGSEYMALTFYAGSDPRIYILRANSYWDDGKGNNLDYHRLYYILYTSIIY